MLNLLSGIGIMPSRRRYSAGEIVRASGEPRSRLCVVARGVVEIRGAYGDYSGSRRAALGLAGPWEPFGYPVFVDAARTVSAEAFTDCEVIEVPRIFLERAVRRRPETALVLTTLLDAALSAREEMIGCLLPRRTETRLARLLLVLAGKFGETEGGRTTIALSLTRRALADMIAATREAVTPVVRSLRERRILLEMERGTVTILDTRSLAGLTDG